LPQCISAQKPVLTLGENLSYHLSMSTAAVLPKYRRVYESLQRQIATGRVRPGARLPSEAELVRQFGASRITVGRALRDLQHAGLIERRAGSGSFVSQPAVMARPRTFGVLMPDLRDVEILQAICDGLMEAPSAPAHVLLFGSSAPDPSRSVRAFQMCEQLIARHVDGVFFAPMEHLADQDAVNRQLAARLDESAIPVVLIDRAVEPYPLRGAHDLIALDNRRAGAQVTGHLLAAGCRRLVFVGLPQSASSVDAREAGFREAVRRRLPEAPEAAVWRGDPADAGAVRGLLDRHSPDGLVCASDRTAALLMQTLIALGVPVPDRVRMAGIDDVAYAGLLPVPLTTVRQPCREIGIAAIAAMIERLRAPELPPREILLHGAIVVRQSCGTHPGVRRPRPEA